MPRETILHLYEHNDQSESIALKHLVQISIYEPFEHKNLF
jgi:hypothetical protein